MNTEEKTRAARERKEAYYNVLLATWISTRNEVDQQLISTSGIGVIVLVTVLAVQGTEGFWQTILYFTAIFGFVTTMICMVIVFHLNSKYLKEVIDELADPNCEDEDIDNRVEDTYKNLMPIDYFGLACFFISMVSCLGIAALSLFS